MEYKKYIVFAWNMYEADGGLNDIKDSFDDLQEARQYLKEAWRDIGDIVDRDTWEIVYRED